MKYLDQFSIPLKGLKLGSHYYSFQISKDFFKYIEDSVISDGSYDIEVKCDNRGSMFVLDFDLKGTYKANCDRCLVEIDIPSEIDYSLIVKVDQNINSNNVLDLSEEIIYIDDRENKLNLSQIFYQLIILSMPLSNTYDCENDPNPKCDFELLKKLDFTEDENQDGENFDNPIWNELKNIIKN
ncbi:MAG: DUF177 domain-containing protein [Saprospiraceae bacterium]